MKMPRIGYTYIVSAHNPILCGTCNQDTQQTFHKIGYTTNDPEMRRQMIETDCPLEIGAMRVTIWDKALEQFLHMQLSHCNIRGEWFRLDSEGLSEAEHYMSNPPDYQFQRRVKKYRAKSLRAFNNIDFSDL